MAWPQSPQPAPAPQSAGGSALPLGPLVTALAGLLTFLFSFVQIIKDDSEFLDIGFSVWTTDPGFFGIGTWIPLFALLAGAAALARSFVPDLATKEVAGFGLLQVQLAAAGFAVLVWLGYMVNILLSDDVTFGLGAFLLFLGLAGVVAGTVLSVLDLKKGTTTTIGTGSGPPSGQWPAPGGPQPHSGPQSGQWPQPTPPPAPGAPPPGAPQQWSQPAPGVPQAPGAPGAPAWNPGAPAAPGQWQPDPGAPPVPPPPPQAPQSWAAPGPEQAWQPPAASDPGGPAPYPAPAPPAPSPEPGPLDPQPAPPVDPGGPSGGVLYDPGTEVIPGPPPAPPADDPGHVGRGPDALPPVPPPNTP